MAREKKPRTEGGTAIMLRLPFSPVCGALYSVIGAQEVSSTRQWKSSPKEDLHLTLGFMGRDLSCERAGLIREAVVDTIAINNREPVILSLSGVLAPLRTWKSNYLVARVEPLDSVLKFRLRLIMAIEAKGLRFPDESWNPHVTLGEYPGGFDPSPGRFQPFRVRCHELTVKCGAERTVVAFADP